MRERAGSGHRLELARATLFRTAEQREREGVVRKRSGVGIHALAGAHWDALRRVGEAGERSLAEAVPLRQLARVQDGG